MFKIDICLHFDFMTRSRSTFVWCVIILQSFHVSVNGQGWAWLGGDKIVDRVSTHQYPGGRSGASTWHEVTTNHTTSWMFGGRGFSEFPSGKPHLLNDLWQFSPASEENLTIEYFVRRGPAVSGTDGDKESNQRPSLWPGSRHHASMCGFSDILVIFGGLGKDSITLGDFWIYNLRNFTWRTQLFKEGPSARGHPAVWCFGPYMYIFGGVGDKQKILDDLWKLNLLTLEWTLLQPSATEMEYPRKSNLPQGRNGPATWISHESLYMFGGNTAPSFSYSLHQSEGLVSDLWQYFPCNNTWALVNDRFKNSQREGHHNGNAHASEYVITNVPGSRMGAGSWADASGDLWLFGGAGVDTHPVSTSIHSKVLSDVWRFRVKTKTWAFIGGSSEGGKAGIYKTLGEETYEGLPGDRTEMMVFPSGTTKIYIFGGVGHDARQIDGYLNDLWSVDISTLSADQYRISTRSLLLFLGFCMSLLFFSLILGLWGRKIDGVGHVRSHLRDNVDSRPKNFDHRYSHLKNTEDF